MVQEEGVQEQHQGEAKEHEDLHIEGFATHQKHPNVRVEDLMNGGLVVNARDSWMGISTSLPEHYVDLDSKQAKEQQADSDPPIWLPHHLLPWGSPVFYIALVLVPLLCIYNEMQDKKLEALNQEMRQERLKRRAEREQHSE
eukprot:s390_g21.t1